MIKAIILDLGNVLINFDHRIAAERISCFTTKSPEEVYRLFFDSEITCLFEEGKISPFEFFFRARKLLSSEIAYDTFLPIWNEIFFLTPENEELYAIAKGLKKHYRLAMLSNVNLLHWEYLKKQFSFFDAFHHIFTSFEIGARKPCPIIYKKALEILNVSPEEAFYVDDREELVEEARKLGIRAFVYKGTRQLKEDLLKIGVNLNEN